MLETTNASDAAGAATRLAPSKDRDQIFGFRGQNAAPVPFSCLGWLLGGGHFAQLSRYRRYGFRGGGKGGGQGSELTPR